ncbi:MAG: hypothetical protein ACD_30C00003G0002 [uncultured bacterium]|uniref:Uncharacterized protein n=4 Tax=Candidatus Daviesiibacteriota TaxID=1752718 RepID=A0A0G0H738_9BACT|nr:MAG: hypothetical protein ACD_30C00003G0002 [uncultured bacterium]KKQ07894.1 MAG: hypothetical protein US19_C0035G0005 [Candidatus Daviesbacteria bacterium GW2011_GWB1_36_5]KKQ15358.1 MAG: hypothetical protein US28_C0018G0004 [Candidatus Daviesbacteria bacterium GW2011_GWA1_36_8]OGE16609.1 MAG: hypothetical protein A2858_02070 [Candidatus Daviesbacteria bacterium RIFCSPHIGHO2_01_FULL_36_37]OGE33674.1 MAG: hypothetical protein A3C99_02165 [Candidatus Daviesbacteria bacterium RIFCSPHIGHO2_02_F
MADEEKKDERSSSSNNTKNLIIGATGVALTAAVAGVAGAILANKELRKNLGKKTVQALEVVSKLAVRAEKEATAGLKYLQSKAQKEDKTLKPAPKKVTKKVKS